MFKIRDMLINVKTCLNLISGSIETKYVHSIITSQNNIIEASMIRPNYNTINMCINAYRTVLPIKKLDVSDYINFSRLNLTRGDKIACDWCSIVNGTTEVMYQSLFLSSIDELNEIKDYQHLDNIRNYLIGSLKYRKNPNKWTTEREKIMEYVPNKEHPLVGKIIDVKVLLTEIELRWCPFKSAVEYYRNYDQRYLNKNILEDDSLFKNIGEYLDKNDSIECWKCNLELNKAFQENCVNEKSPFDELRKYLIDMK